MRSLFTQAGRRPIAFGVLGLSGLVLLLPWVRSLADRPSSYSPVEIKEAYDATKARMEAVGVYHKSAVECSMLADAASKQLFESLVNEGESHFDQFDRQLDNIKQFGLNYLALQSFAAATKDSGGAAEA